MNLIDGIKIDVTSAELKATLEQRRDHHREKTAFYKQQVAKLALELFIVAFINGFDGFVGFFEHHWFEAFVRLLAVPRTAAGRTEAGHQVHQ